jgi:L-ribulokinase
MTANGRVSCMSEQLYTVGVDFGTLSARAVVARCSDGRVMGSSEFVYPHAVMQQTLAASGEALPVDWALQDPNDYIAALQHAVPAALAASSVPPSQVIAIGTDFTACTVLPVTADGVRDALDSLYLCDILSRYRCATFRSTCSGRTLM